MVAIRPLGKVLLILVFLSHHTLLRGFFCFCFFPPSSRCPRLAIFGVSTLFCFCFCFFFVPLGFGLNQHFYHTSPWFLLAILFRVVLSVIIALLNSLIPFFRFFIILQANITPWSSQVMLAGYVESWFIMCNPHVFAAHSKPLSRYVLIPLQPSFIFNSNSIFSFIWNAIFVPYKGVFPYYNVCSMQCQR